jgi:hypothetical protein
MNTGANGSSGIQKASDVQIDVMKSSSSLFGKPFLALHRNFSLGAEFWQAWLDMQFAPTISSSSAHVQCNTVSVDLTVAACVLFHGANQQCARLASVDIS